MSSEFSFKRPHLASAYCDSLAGKGIADATSGLFLAGARRVGKSTFLIEDLIPEIKQREWLPVYVDLWANKRADPALLIIEAVKATITQQKSKLSKLVKRIHLQKIKILKTVELDFSKPGLPQNITLTDLLSDLSHLTGKPTVLIIDEAQHALTSEDGINAMFAIKSARDQINIPASHPQLMLVLTGSNRDKLAQLLIKKDQPFFGSDVTPFPVLEKDFTDTFTAKVNDSLVADNQFDSEVVWEAFRLLGHRPEILRQLVGRVAINHDAASFSELLKQNASIWHGQMWEEFENEFSLLNPLQRALLTKMIDEGQAWSPFAEESMSYYKQVLDDSELSVSTVQTAIRALRDREFIWQSSRGVYALEDQSFADWFRHTQQEKIHV